ncbi:hypothetical protein D3C76_1150510 [compost metagenome]
MRAGAGLLDHMGQLVGDQVLAGRGGGRVLAGTEHQVASHRIGVGVDLMGRAFRLAAEVHPDLGKVVAETRLHMPAHGRLQRLTGALQGSSHALRRGHGVPVAVAGEALDS